MKNTHQKLVLDLFHQLVTKKQNTQIFFGCVTIRKTKIQHDPSLDRSWREFFKIIKDHGSTNPPPGCNLGALLPSPSGIFFKKTSAECSVHSKYPLEYSMVYNKRPGLNFPKKSLLNVLFVESRSTWKSRKYKSLY